MRAALSRGPRPSLPFTRAGWPHDKGTTSSFVAGVTHASTWRVLVSGAVATRGDHGPVRQSRGRDNRADPKA